METWHLGLAAIILWSEPLQADLTIEQRVEEPGGRRPAAEIRLKIKGQKIRADLSTEVTLLMDTATGDTTTLFHTRKTALHLNGSTARLFQKEIERFPAPEEPPKLVATGRQETVSGHETEIYTMESGSIKMTWWIARKESEWDKYHPQIALLRQTPMVRLAEGLRCLPAECELPGLAVKTELCTPDKRRIIITLTAIKEEPLENADFAIPPGYRPLTEPLPPLTR